MRGLFAPAPSMRDGTEVAGAPVIEHSFGDSLRFKADVKRVGPSYDHMAFMPGTNRYDKQLYGSDTLPKTCRLDDLRPEVLSLRTSDSKFGAKPLI